MHNYLSSVLSVFRGRHHARQVFIRQILWLLLACLLIGHMLPGFRSTPIQRPPSQHRLPNQSQPTKKEKVSSPVLPRYDCSGGLQQNSKAGQEYIEQAVKDALDILKRCKHCRQIFDSEGSDYPIELLERLRQDKVIIISAESPTIWRLSHDHKTLKVIESEKLKESAAVVVDLAGSRAGEMKKPCMYINPMGFIVTGQRAENFGLYGLPPHVQRAVAIIHELGHIAGVIQYDGQEREDPLGNRKSVENTNCVRANCISCKAFQPCPNAPEPLKQQRSKRKISNLNPYNSDGLQGLARASSFGRINR